MPGDVAHGQRDQPVARVDEVVPVAADRGLALGGLVAGHRVEHVRDAEIRQQAALEDERDAPLLSQRLVAARVEAVQPARRQEGQEDADAEQDDERGDLGVERAVQVAEHLRALAVDHDQPAGLGQRRVAEQAVPVLAGSHGNAAAPGAHLLQRIALRRGRELLERPARADDQVPRAVDDRRLCALEEEQALQPAADAIQAQGGRDRAGGAGDRNREGDDRHVE